MTIQGSCNAYNLFFLDTLKIVIEQQDINHIKIMEWRTRLMGILYHDYKDFMCSLFRDVLETFQSKPETFSPEIKTDTS